MAFIRMIGITGLAFAMPVAAYAASPTTFADLVDDLVGWMNLLIGTVVTAALVIYFFGVLQHMMKREQLEGGWDMRKFLLMGVLTIFVMVSIWGILEIMRNTFEGRNATGAGVQGSTNQENCASFEECAKNAE